MMMGVMLLAITMVYSQPTAEELLAEVSAKIKSYSGMSADFRFTMLNDDAGINESSTGSILLKGDKFKMHTNEFGMTIWNDGENQWTMIDGSGEVNLEKASDVEGGINPSKIFKVHEQGMKSSIISEQGSIVTIKLVPMNSDGEVKSVELSVDKSKSSIDKAIIYGSDGGKYVIDISNLKVDANLPDSEFAFNKAKNANVDIIDLR